MFLAAENILIVLSVKSCVHTVELQWPCCLVQFLLLSAGGGGGIFRCLYRHLNLFDLV